MIGSLSLDQLKVLVAVADTGSFSAAARKLGRVQSAISQTVQTLEDAQGVQLFDRSGHKPGSPRWGKACSNRLGSCWSAPVASRLWRRAHAQASKPS
ncbi:LysR family transcriptional regulator [Lichenifustis flavocetrariae]|uniref:LysR family transcriptional regulator n=1 Tax=Lichenifustis flavocetrariae TaxID=2949735 RepID=A0AA41YXP2_9HYPH|nr:LysR family transcriptional regulator [Lichenifustis flavocetrariae]MCW6510044.1 LysR family transcriptional regulator [Lichenifustis flavocetrariae]